MPHVTLKSIANNPDIKEGMTRAQIDQAIARHAETETLYDKPYEDTKRVRVSGPFTVESLSPHRVLATDEETPRTETDGARESTVDFATMILDNLKKGRRPEHGQERAAQVRHAGAVRRHLAARDGHVDRRRRQSHPRRRLDRPRARHGRPAAGEGSRQGGRSRASASTS